MVLTIHATRFAELGYTRIDKSTWRFVDMATGAVVGPYYRSKPELIADMARYAASFGCAEHSALRQLPTMPKYGSVPVDVWEPVPDKPGYSRRASWRAVTEVRNDLCAALALHLPEEWGKLDYFCTRSAAPRTWQEGVLACFPLVGGSEGYYFHVDVIQPRDNFHKPDQWHSLILGKTLCEGEEGFAVVSRLAIACAQLPGA